MLGTTAYVVKSNQKPFLQKYSVIKTADAARFDFFPIPTYLN